MNIELNVDNLPGYLAGRGLTTNPRELHIEALGGGVSNIVLRVERPGGAWVVKQSLGKLRVADDWRSQRDRIFKEAEAIQALRTVVGQDALPEVIDVDRDNFTYVMTAAPEGSEPWKTALLAGHVDLNAARRAGELLAKIGAAAHSDPSLQHRFEDRSVFDQLRIDPYYRVTAARHPEMKLSYDKLIADSWSIRTALVHGDYSPKNILVKGGSVVLIDFEVVHWGDPAFDAGFMLNHLFLKALHQPQYDYFAAARVFWRSLVSGIRTDGIAEFEQMMLRHLGGLMLARIDGKSPVEYIRREDVKNRARELARSIMLERPGSLEEAIRMADRYVCRE